MPVTKTVVFDPAKAPEDYLTKEERELRDKNPTPHTCNLPTEREVADLGYGPGTIFTCEETYKLPGGQLTTCGIQRKLVHIGIAPQRMTDKQGKFIGQELPPLAWKVVR